MAPPDWSWKPMARWSVFLSVGWSEGSGEALSAQALDIDEAVLSLVRAIITEGGDIAMVEHPAFSPLVAFITGHYQPPSLAEGSQKGRREEPPSVHVLREREPTQPESDLDASLGYLRFDSGPLQAFLERLRPRAMVCIGGTEELESHYESFLRLWPTGHVYALTTTGGRAAELARRDPTRVLAIDEQILRHLEHESPRESELPSEDVQRPELFHEQEPDLLPYPLIMQVLAGELGRGQTPGPEPTPTPLLPTGDGSGTLVPA